MCQNTIEDDKWYIICFKFQMTSAVDMCSSSSNSSSDSLLTYTYARDIECLPDSDQLIVDQNMMKKKMVWLELVHANLCWDKCQYHYKYFLYFKLQLTFNKFPQQKESKHLIKCINFTINLLNGNCTHQF